MRTHFIVGAAWLAGVLFAAACSSNPKPEEPQSGATTTETSEPEPSPTSDPGPETSTLAPGGVVKTTGMDGDQGIPDDYQLVTNDCVQLGKKLGELWRVELRASLSPKLTEKQREKAEENIQDGASKKEESWADGCIKSLVGKSVDPKALKCAFNSKDLKAFEACLN
ncbi:MAG: hypothetical protein IPK82_09945 [Polyangiaceae bacterium]|nr:hypothetical protein [Polyangiaceae bacterium]